MDVLFDSGSAGFTTSTTTHTEPHTCTGSDLVLLVHVLSTSSGTTGVTYDSVAMTQQGSEYTFNNGYKASLWYLIAPSTGANNVVATVSSSSNVFVNVVSYKNANQASFPDNFTTGNAFSVDQLDTDLTPVADGCIVVLAASGRSRLIAAGTTTQRSTDSVVSMFGDSGLVDPATSTTVSSERDTSGTTDRHHFVVSIAPVSSAAAAKNPLFFGGGM